MTEYTVTWMQVISADSPVDAAEKALKIQRNPESTAIIFDVYNIRTCELRTVDLYDLP